MKKLNTTSYWIMALCFIVTSLNAQTNCEYTLRLSDDFRDSWNGALLTLNVNEDINIYSMGINDGNEIEFPLIFQSGDTISLEFTSGRFDNEITYQLLDPNGEVVFEDGPSPTAGEVFSDTITCPACSPVAFSGIIIEDIRDFTARLSWLQGNDDNTYWVQYGEDGFDPELEGSFLARNTNRNSIDFEDLMENTAYDIYISSLCGSDTSMVAGPISFKTVYTNDVGIIGILTPITGCEIGNIDSVEVVLKNFGANPQSLIPFNFTNNGVPGGVNQPFDGVFTGVLGRDSTFTITFDTRADILAPNIYEIVAFTEMMNDSDMSNDTFRIEIINIPNIMEYPYFTDFEDWTGGWRPDEDSQNSSWEFGTPSLGTMSAASGRNAWVTSLDTTYNNNELSYLISPCLDFTSLEEDPIISFNLFVATESCCDEAWVEVSSNAGDTWSKVQISERSLNWYNDEENEWWDGDGGINPWTPVSSLLTGTAGAAEVLVRVAFSSDFSANSAGIGVDNIFISEPLENDMASISVDHTSLAECGEEGDQVILEIVNLGESEQRGFSVLYQVNGGAVVSEQINVPIAPLETLSYTFDQTFNSSLFQNYTILAWTEGLNDEFMFNDTARVDIETLRPIPFAENFERGVLPEGWITADEPNPISIGHGASSFVLSDNLWDLDNYFEATSPVFGFVAENDSLTFEYRYVNFGIPGNNTERTLAPGDSLIVSLSTDCGEIYMPIFRADSLTHEPSDTMLRVTVQLNEYVGSTIKLRFQAYREAGSDSGDYFIDIDNVNVVRCGPSLELSIEETNLSRPDIDDGSLIVDAAAGLPPYTYEWSNGETNKGNFGLEAGSYTVTVTDAVGCSDVITATVNVATNIEDVDALKALQLVPNPTSGNTELQIELLERAEVKVQLFNAMGQLLREFPTQTATELNYSLDLSSYANGLYFVQIWANGQGHTERLVLLRE